MPVVAAARCVTLLGEREPTMHVDTIEALALRFEAGQLSGDEYLLGVDRERAISLPPAANDGSTTPSSDANS